MFKVYHYDMNKYHHSFGKWYLRTPTAMQDVDAPKFPDEYVLAADVNTDDIDDVFRLTNNIDRNWDENEEVNATGKSLRSTSVGDVVVDAEGKALICASMGWEEI